MLTFYKNKSQTFECNVEIEGADGNSAKSRLILSPNNDNKKIFFEGEVNAQKCKILVPPLSNISNQGNIVLEIIVEDTLFSPWESVYEIKEPVKVESVELTKSKKNVKMIKDDVQLKTEKPKVKIQPIITEEPKKKKDGIIRETASLKDRNLVKKYLNEFKKEKDKNLIKEFINGEYFTPKSSTIKWAKGVLNNTKSNIAKTIMYYHEN